MRINFKTVLVGFLFLLLYVGAGYFYLSHSLETLYETKYKEVSQRMQRELEVLVKEKLEAVLLLDVLLAQNKDIKDLLMGKEVPDLDLHKHSRILRENTPLKNIWFHIINKDGVSIYRSWSNKKGDSLVGIRKEMASMIKEPRMDSLISIGKFDMTFKSMTPIYSEDIFLGYVETLARFNSIVYKLQKYNFETIVLVDKSYKKQLTDTPRKEFIEDYYISSFSGSKKLMDAVIKNGIAYFLEISDYVIDEKNKQLISIYRLPDRDGNKMGYFITSIDLKNIDMKNIEASKHRIVVGLALGFLIITGFLFYLYMVNYKNFIQRQKKELEETVVKKTKELREKSEEMTHLAHHDSLTSLPNRLLFLQKLKQAIIDAEQKKQTVGVLFLDLDGFKEINDSYGHKTGDLLLQKITQRLKNVVREEDIVARLGGDEFTIIVHSTTVSSLEAMAQKIILEIQKPVQLDSLELFVTFSIGLSLYPEDGDSPELLLKYADTAMYRAKDQGKNRYQFYNTSMTEMTMEKVTLQNALREAVRLKQFVPYFQPKIDARSGKVIGLESLVRWNHPEKGLVSPMDFIPFAEEIGVIGEIDKLMLYTTLLQIQEWHREGIKTGRVSLNISNKQLEEPSCIESFRDYITELDFDTKYLELEVTESQVMKNRTKSIQVLKEIKNLGIKISMDDFGTGYSSLSYLKHLPVDRMKIDRSFIQDTPGKKDDVAIVKTIIALAHNLELDLIAEGVESKEQVDFLVKEGCFKIQGYYYSRPLSAKDCRDFLIANI